MLCLSYLALILSAVRFRKASENQPKHTWIEREREKAWICPHMYTNSVFIPCLTRMPYQHNQPSEIRY